MPAPVLFYKVSDAFDFEREEVRRRNTIASSSSFSSSFLRYCFDKTAKGLQAAFLKSDGRFQRQGTGQSHLPLTYSDIVSVENRLLQRPGSQYGFSGGHSGGVIPRAKPNQTVRRAGFTCYRPLSFTPEEMCWTLQNRYLWP